MIKLPLDKVERKYDPTQDKEDQEAEDIEKSFLQGGLSEQDNHLNSKDEEAAVSHNTGAGVVDGDDAEIDDHELEDLEYCEEADDEFENDSTSFGRLPFSNESSTSSAILTDNYAHMIDQKTLEYTAKNKAIGREERQAPTALDADLADFTFEIQSGAGRLRKNSFMDDESLLQRNPSTESHPREDEVAKIYSKVRGKQPLVPLRSVPMRELSAEDRNIEIEFGMHHSRPQRLRRPSQESGDLQAELTDYLASIDNDPYMANHVSEASGIGGVGIDVFDPNPKPALIDRTNHLFGEGDVDLVRNYLRTIASQSSRARRADAPILVVPMDWKAARVAAEATGSAHGSVYRAFENPNVAERIESLDRYGEPARCGTLYIIPGDGQSGDGGAMAGHSSNFGSRGQDLDDDTPIRGEAIGPPHGHQRLAGLISHGHVSQTGPELHHSMLRKVPIERIISARHEDHSIAEDMGLTNSQSQCDQNTSRSVSVLPLNMQLSNATDVSADISSGGGSGQIPSSEGERATVTPEMPNPQRSTAPATMSTTSASLPSMSGPPLALPPLTLKSSGSGGQGTLHGDPSSDIIGLGSGNTGPQSSGSIVGQQHQNQNQAPITSIMKQPQSVSHPMVASRRWNNNSNSQEMALRYTGASVDTKWTLSGETPRNDLPKRRLTDDSTVPPDLGMDSNPVGLEATLSTTAHDQELQHPVFQEPKLNDVRLNSVVTSTGGGGGSGSITARSKRSYEAGDFLEWCKEQEELLRELHVGNQPHNHTPAAAIQRSSLPGG
eukprot:Clim_evm40s191 gene=Clim_evmTU40s191